MNGTPAQMNGTKLPFNVRIVEEFLPARNGRAATVPEKSAAPDTRVPLAEPVPAAPASDPVAEAEAEAIRAHTAAEIKATELRAQAEADAIRTKAEAEAEKQRLANERTRMAMEEKQAAHDKRLAEIKAQQEEIDRQAEARRVKMQAEVKAEAEQLKDITEADDKWRKYAIRFAFVCGIVSLPVQMSFFWNPHAPWMAAAPVMLEGAAWVVHRGARAAVANRRPVWHYRTIVWLLAFVAAAINLYHGLHSFDPGTALATAFASVAGPGVWDLHEHGRIRRRDGVLPRRERRAKAKAEAAAAKEKAAAEKAAADAKAAEKKAADDAAAQLAADRERDYPDEWKYAVRLASAKSETTVTDAIWEEAWDVMHAAKPGVTVESVNTRNAAARRMANATGTAAANTPSKVTSAQRAIQIKGPARRSSYKPVPPVRTPGDTLSYHPAARRAHGETKRRSNAAKNASTDTAN